MENSIQLARMAFIALQIANDSESTFDRTRMTWVEDPSGLFYSEVPLSVFSTLAEQFGFDPVALQVEVLHLPTDFCLPPHYHTNSFGVIVPILPHGLINFRGYGVTLETENATGERIKITLGLGQAFSVPAQFVHGLRVHKYSPGTFVLSLQSASTEEDTVLV